MRGTLFDTCYNSGMGLLILGAVFLWLFPLSVVAAAEATPYEDAVYVYDLFRDAPNCADLADRLKALPLRSTLILGTEQRDGFLLDRPEGEEELACVFDSLRRSSRKAKALLAQDTVFLKEKDEAARRALLVSGFAARHPGVLSGVQLDVEPYTDPQWACCTVEQRHTLMRDLQELLRLVRRQLHGVPLSVTAPWWYPLEKDLPEAQPESLFRVADEIYLMVYGDEGGPLVGGAADRVLSRVDAPEFFAGRGRVFIVLATYESLSPAQLETDLATLRRRLASRPNFGGTAIFHAASSFHVPLVRTLSGTVTDPDGQPLPGVETEAAEIHGRSNDCGQFSLRGFPGSQAEVTLRKPGYVTRKLSVDLPVPGDIREWGKIVLEKEKEQPPADSPEAVQH
jgi:carboxypeptidase family protein